MGRSGLRPATRVIRDSREFQLRNVRPISTGITYHTAIAQMMPPRLTGTSTHLDDILESLGSVNSRSPCKRFNAMTLHNQDFPGFRVSDLVTGTVQHFD